MSGFDWLLLQLSQMYQIYFIFPQVMGFLTEKVKEKPDPNSKTAIDFDSKVTAERDKQIKVIVPNSTAGMIIGKGGSYIKHLKETSGSFIQLSQKAKDNTLPERVVTIIGENCKKRQDQANPIFQGTRAATRWR